MRYINDRHHRTGTLWEGRYKACPVDRDSYLVHCYRYIELNPVRARMVGDPDGYRWSSYGANAHGRPDPLVTPHPVFLALGRDAQSRQTAYRELARQAISDDDLSAIRLQLQRQHALGTDRFRAAIEAQLGRCAGPAKIGRPRTRMEVHSDPAFARLGPAQAAVRDRRRVASPASPIPNRTSEPGSGTAMVAAVPMTWLPTMGMTCAEGSL